MNQLIRIAARNTTRQKKRSLMLGGAIAFGFSIITLVNGFSAGLVDSVKDNISWQFGGQIYISGAQLSDRGSEIALLGDTGTAFSAVDALGDQVASVHQRSKATGSFYFGTREETVRLEGIDLAGEQELLDHFKVLAGDLADLGKPASVAIPEDAAKKLGIEVGEAITFRVSTVTGQQNVGEFIVVAITAGDAGLGFASAYTAKTGLNELIGLDEDEFQSLNVYLQDINDVDQAADAIHAGLAAKAAVEPRAEFGNDESSHMSSMRRMIGMGGIRSVALDEQWAGTKFTVTTIEDVMAPILSLVGILDLMSFWVFVILVVIIMVGIVNSYRMILLERTKEIGTMRAIGVQKAGIRDIFLWEAFITSAAGALTGFVVALVIAGLLSLFDLGGSGLFSLFLSDGRLAFQAAPVDTIRNFAIICLMSLAAAYLPAKAASRLQPAAALRATY
ncbi:MAG: FtsX-like permease family protein [Spirochaetia bacterium]|jgi:putative ABC transport system permease protein|nr:FtsX-like permease family protein [Spirochaetia bacterium]